MAASLPFGCMVQLNRPLESSSFYNLRISIVIASSFFWSSFRSSYPDSLNILQVDNGAFHKAKDLVIPNNIILLFQPPYFPELNPIERLWQHLKQYLRWSLFKDLTQLQIKVDKLIADLTLETVASITGFSFYSGLPTGAYTDLWTAILPQFYSTTDIVRWENRLGKRVTFN